jgi:hypothetical protein
VNLPFQKGESHDPSQGDFVWRSIDQSKGDTYESFKYELSRERPHPDGVYPEFTFIKYKNDTDGNLLLTDFTAQIHLNGKMTPVTMNYQYMILIPAKNVTVEVATPTPQQSGTH